MYVRACVRARVCVCVSECARVYVFACVIVRVCMCLFACVCFYLSVYATYISPSAHAPVRIWQKHGAFLQKYRDL